MVDACTGTNFSILITGTKFGTKFSILHVIAGTKFSTTISLRGSTNGLLLLLHALPLLVCILKISTLVCE
jgi:hypothetical protein